MSAEPSEPTATAEGLCEADAAAAAAELDEWETAGRPGARSHEEFMAELLGEPDMEIN